MAPRAKTEEPQPAPPTESVFDAIRGLVPMPPAPPMDAHLMVKLAYAQAVAPTLTTDKHVKVVGGKANYAYDYITEGLLTHLHRSLLPRLGVATVTQQGTIERVYSHDGESWVGYKVEAILTLTNVFEPSQQMVVTCWGFANDTSDKGPTKAYTTARRLALNAFWQQGGAPDTEQDASADMKDAAEQRGGADKALRVLFGVGKDALGDAYSTQMLRRVVGWAAGEPMPPGVRFEDAPALTIQRAIDYLRQWKDNPAAGRAALETWSNEWDARHQPVGSARHDPSPVVDIADPARAVPSGQDTPSAEDVAQLDSIAAVSLPTSDRYDPTSPLYRIDLDPSHPDYIPF